MIIRQNNTRTNHIRGKIGKCSLKCGKNVNVKHPPTSIRLFLMSGTQRILSHRLFLSENPSFSSHLNVFPVLASLDREGIPSVLSQGVLSALRLPIPSSLSLYAVASGAFSLSASFSSRATFSPRLGSELSDLPQNGHFSSVSHPLSLFCSPPARSSNTRQFTEQNVFC